VSQKIYKEGIGSARARLSTDEDEGAPVIRKVAAVALADDFALRELGLTESFGFVEAGKPFRIEEGHELLGFLIGNRPHAHHDGIGAGFLKGAAEAEDALAVALLAEAGFARAEHDELGALKVELAGFIAVRMPLSHRGRGPRRSGCDWRRRRKVRSGAWGRRRRRAAERREPELSGAGWSSRKKPWVAM